jgi:hypothetical protein
MATGISGSDFNTFHHPKNYWIYFNGDQHKNIKIYQGIGGITMKEKPFFEIHADGVDTQDIMRKIRKNIKERKTAVIQTLYKKTEEGYIPISKEDKEMIMRRKKIRLGLMR